MVRAEIHADNLQAYYVQLRRAQELAHGGGYCSHHGIIAAAVAHGCTSYAELGVNQGCTLACALLAGFGSVEGVDMALGPWRPAERLFRTEARARGTMLSLWEQDSRLPIGEVDFMLFDCHHTTAGLRQELEAHGQNVRRFILIHDTAAVPALHNTAVAWGLAHRATVQQRETSGHGWTLLQRQA